MTLPIFFFVHISFSYYCIPKIDPETKIFDFLLKEFLILTCTTLGCFDSSLTNFVSIRDPTKSLEDSTI